MLKLHVLVLTLVLVVEGFDLYDERTTTTKAPLAGLEKCNRTHLYNALSNEMNIIGKELARTIGKLQNDISLDESITNGISNQMKPVLQPIQNDFARAFSNEFCKFTYSVGQRDGTHSFNVGGTRSATLYCERGWTVVQRRTTGALNFHRPWADFDRGFGTPQGEYWMGLSLLYSITSLKARTLRIETMADPMHRVYHTLWSEFPGFSITSAADEYRARIQNGKGNQPNVNDLITNINNYQFSTYNNDNDGVYRVCPNDHLGGWWYARLYSPFRCTRVNLNGRAGWDARAQVPGCTGGNGVCAYWYPYRLKQTLMMIQ